MPPSLYPRQADHEISKLFVERWSPRAWTDELISQEDLLRILEAARWAPSAFNAQPWRFIYARRDTEAWEPVFTILNEYNRGWNENAAAVVLVVSRKFLTPPGATEEVPGITHAFDAGAAWMSMALQALSMGWHTHGMAGVDRALAHERFGISDKFTVEMAWSIGKLGAAAQLPPELREREFPSPRRPLHETAAEAAFPFQ